MAVTGIRALLEAAEFLKKEEIAKSRELLTSSNSIDVKELLPIASFSAMSDNDSSPQLSSGSQNLDSISSNSERAAPCQDREAHNKLEKDRRADLKARFEKLQSLVPTTKGKKCSNLSILRNASRYIHSQTRLEREFVSRIQLLSHQKSQLDKSLERAWQRLSVLGVDLARVRRKVRSKHAQREKREESSARDHDNLDDGDRKDGERIDKSFNGRGPMKPGGFECGDDTENHSRSMSPCGSLLLAGSAEVSSVSDDDEEGSESTTTASECGSNPLECGEITDEASECGEIVVQEGIVPSQAHTCVSLCPVPLSPPLQDSSNGAPATVTTASFQLRYATSCSMSGSFASSASGLSVTGSEPQSGTSSDSGISSGVNDENNGEVKLPMKKRKLARSLVQDLSSTQESGSVVTDRNTNPTEPKDLPQPPEKKIALSSAGTNNRWFKNVSSEKPRSENAEKHISLITTLPSCASLPTPVATTSNSVGMSPSTPLSNSMPLLQRTLTDPRTPPANLVRHLSFESPENLNPNWMNQRIVPVYQLLSGTQNGSPPSSSASLPASPPAAQHQPPVSTVIASALSQSCIKPLPVTVDTVKTTPTFTTTLSGFHSLGGATATGLHSLATTAIGHPHHPHGPIAPPPPPPEKLSLVTHSPVNSMLKAATVNTNPAAPPVLAAHPLNGHPPQFATLASPSPVVSTNHQAGGGGGATANSAATHLVLPVIGPSDGQIILRNLTTSAGRHQPIVLMPITASTGPSQNTITSPTTSLVPVQLVSDGVLSTATVMNGRLDHT